MTPTLYTTPTSPPVRAVLMTAKDLGVTLNNKVIDTANTENRKPEYLKMNPQHTVPTLVEEDGFTVWDSHAIITYLVSKYGKNDSLYPKDLKKRAVVDQRLHFESGVIFAGLKQTLGSIRLKGTGILQEHRDMIEEIYGFLEAFLEGKQWIAGDSVTVADYSIFSSTSTINVVIPADNKKFPKLCNWLKKVEGLPAAEANTAGLKIFTEAIGSILNFTK